MQLVHAYIRFCRRYTGRILAVIAMLTVGAAILASQLGIEGDIARMLPQSAPSVAGLKLLEREYGGQIGRLTVVLEAKSASNKPYHNPRLEKLADQLGTQLAHVDGVRRVEARRPLQFFEDHRLLYVSLDDLQTVKKRLDERVRWEKERANPLFVGLEDKPPPEVDFSDLVDKYKRGLPQSPYYVSKDGRMLALFVYPSFPANDMVSSHRLVRRVDALVHRDLAGVSGVTYGLTGRYKKRIDLQAMLTRDLALSTGLALVLLLAFLFAFIRSVRGTLMVIIPLVVGTIWTFAWAEVTFGSLNILTAFLGAVLLGLGVDYGIHLYSRFHELLAEYDPRRALYETLTSTGRANVFAALTTMVALGSLLVSDFRAFYEFGVISLGGLLLILLAYLVLFPCGVLLAERHGIDLPAPASGALTTRIVDWLSSSSRPAGAERVQTLGNLAWAVLVVLVLAAAIGLPHVRFVRDFSAVQSTSAPSWKLDERVNAMLGQSQTPAVVLTNSPQQSQRVVAELRRRKHHTPQGYTIDKVVSLASFVPEHQSAKLHLLDQLEQELRDLPKRARKGDVARYLTEISRVVQGGEISVDQLPTEVRVPFSRKNSAHKGVVLIYPAISLSDMNAVDDYALAIRHLPGVNPSQGYDAISDALMLSDIITMIEKDASLMLAITITGLVILSIVAFRNRILVSLQLAVQALSILVALGLNGLFGISFNFMNIVILPIWIGLGVDASFHVLMHLNHGHRLEPHSNVGLAIAAAYLTSMIGFGTLLLARHKGLFSLGEVAVVGLGSILAVNLLVQMTLVAGQRRLHDARATTQP